MANKFKNKIRNIAADVSISLMLTISFTHFDAC